MTIQQLQCVFEISRTGSMSKAARNLYMSQPNISSGIKNLENELGIVIFERSPMGMKLTPEGKRLIQKAATIMKAIEEITSDKGCETAVTFRLMHSRYMPALEAFVDMIKKYEKEPEIQLFCYGTGELKQQAEALYQNICDVTVYVALSPWEQDIARICSNYQVQFELLKESCLYIQLSETHPLLERLDSWDDLTMDMLGEYPCIVFSDPSDYNSNWYPWDEVINPEKVICVDSINARVSAVANTNAYSLVVYHPEDYNRRNHVVQIPFREQAGAIGYFYSVKRGMSELAKDYIELLKNKMHI